MDLVVLSGVNVQKLTSQGFFENLDSYVEQSETFGRSDFVDESVFKYHALTWEEASGYYSGQRGQKM